MEIGRFSGGGPYAMDINWDLTDGTPQGPFALLKPIVNPVPHLPDALGTRLEATAEPYCRTGLGGSDQGLPCGLGRINEKAARVWATATRAHYNSELRFNSQSLIVATTERPAIGGRAWPSVILGEPEHEYAFALWCNSTLGLLLHWWTANKTQAGRGTTTVTAIPRIPALDMRALTPAQHEAAREAFEALRGERFLPFDQIDEDPARAELDRRLLLGVLGLPPSLCADGGPLALLRRKLAAEPQIHGGKRTRVVFEGGGERTERRPPR